MTDRFGIVTAEFGNVTDHFGKTGAAGGGGTYYFDDLTFIP